MKWEEIVAMPEPGYVLSPTLYGWNGQHGVEPWRNLSVREPQAQNDHVEQRLLFDSQNTVTYFCIKY